MSGGAESSLQEVRAELARKERELAALIKGGRAVLEQESFSDTARAIFDYCRGVIGAASGYVALLNEQGDENELLFLEAGGLPCSVSPDLPMPIRGLRERAYRLNETVFDNDFMHSQWVCFMPKGHVRLDNVLFAPLVLAGWAVGLLGLANKKGGFDSNDVRTASAFGELAAIALHNTKIREEHRRHEQERDGLIKELTETVEKVQTLKGLLPICANCKKVRDDQGYWNQIEAYISQRSGAEFSHAICPECAKHLYPDQYGQRG